MITMYRFTQAAMHAKYMYSTTGATDGLTEEQIDLIKRARYVGLGTDSEMAAFAQAVLAEINKEDGLVKAVARVALDDLEDYFSLSNNPANGNWKEHEAVEIINEDGYFSSESVGDICQLNDKFYICAPFGFEEISLVA